ncbi:MAG: OsmC family peroxiredoxin [Balneolaceae bacterium]|nr:MAG: OsmC family peroxiredoxin [Balneolaceae bacterium]
MGKEGKKKIVHLHLPKENYKTIMHAGRHELIADEPQELGGADTGPDPYDYLLMSLGSCSVITMRMYAERKKWPLEDVYIEMRHYKTEAEEDGKSVNRDVIEKEITLVGELDDQQTERIIEISKRCPVHRTLLNSAEILTSGALKK